MKRGPIVIYHRANSPFLIDSATTDRIDGIELDVRMTADGVVVVHHDRRVKSYDGRFHFVDKIAFSELKALRGTTLMTLAEALDKIAEYRAETSSAETSRSPFILDLDLKQSGIEKGVAAIVKRKRIDSSRIVVFSPDIWALKEIESLLPGVQIGLTYNPLDNWDLMQSKMFRYLATLTYYSIKPFMFRLIRRKSAKGDIQIAGIYYKMLSKEVVQFLHQYDIAVYGWGTNDKRTIKRMIALGVDGIKTSRPDQIAS